MRKACLRVSQLLPKGQSRIVRSRSAREPDMCCLRCSTRPRGIVARNDIVLRPHGKCAIQFNDEHTRRLHRKKQPTCGAAERRRMQLLALGSGTARASAMSFIRTRSPSSEEYVRRGSPLRTIHEDIIFWRSYAPAPCIARVVIVAILRPAGARQALLCVQRSRALA
jgi:hypothetical protein